MTSSYSGVASNFAGLVRANALLPVDGDPDNAATTAVGQQTVLDIEQFILDGLLRGQLTSLQKLGAAATSTSKRALVSNGAGGLFLAHSNASTPLASYSLDDGYTWVAMTAPPGVLADACTNAAGVVVAVGSAVASTPTCLSATVIGTAFTNRAAGTGSATLSACAWSPTLGLFVALGTNVVTTSPDGTTWTLRSGFAGSSCDQVVWCGFSTGLFLALTSSSTTGYYTSPDGINWTLRTLPEGTFVGSGEKPIAFLNGTAVFFSSAGNVWTTTDGISWTSRGANGFSAASVISVATSRAFVATTSIGGSSNVPQLMKWSRDGVVWGSGYGPPAPMNILGAAGAGANAPYTPLYLGCLLDTNWKSISPLIP